METNIAREQAGVTTDANKQQLQKLIIKHFQKLRAAGMSPNEAAAEALNLATAEADSLTAGAAMVAAQQESAVMDVNQLIALAEEAKKSGTGSEAVATAVSRLFATPQVVLASQLVSVPEGGSSGDTVGEQPPQLESTTVSVDQQPASSQPGAENQQGHPQTSANAAVPDGDNDSLPDLTDDPVSDTEMEEDSPTDAEALEAAEASEQGEIDYALVERMYGALAALDNADVTRALMEASAKLAGSLASHRAPLWLSLLLLENPLLEDPEHGRVLAGIGRVVGDASESDTNPANANRVQDIIERLTEYPADRLQRLVWKLQQLITIEMFDGIDTSPQFPHGRVRPNIQAAVKLLHVVYRANEWAGTIPPAEFYNDAVNADDFNLKEDFIRSILQVPTFSFCKYPWIYQPAAKAEILRLENGREQFQEFQAAMMRHLLGGGNPNPYLYLKVRRGPNLVHDTLLQVQNAAARGALKRPLKVSFVYEEGVDEGGVQKEFFQLLMRDLFDPNYGMFKFDQATRLYWFRPSHIDLGMEFELVGIMLGLAIYNNHLLEFSFPMLTYSKLLGHEPTLDDMDELYPDIAANLRKLLEPGCPVDDLGLFFQVEQETDFGDGVETVDLVPGGGSKPVTAQTVQEYVHLYTQHLLDGSITEQFDAFKRGFNKLLDGDMLAMFRPEELEAVVCGSRDLDFLALQSNARYEDGYTATSPVIQWFWEVVHAWDNEQKKKLLFFVTGSDRVPIRGLADLSPRFAISRNGSHSDRLPTAHTCFNHLLLPQYSDKEALRTRLLLAINNAEGFGLR